MLQAFKSLFFQQPVQPLPFLDPLIQKLDNMEKELINESGPEKLASQNQLGISIMQDSERNIRLLRKFLKKLKIYIVFMGTTSAGKSTLLNSLLAQQILPSKNQSCTEQVIFIKNGPEIKVSDKSMNISEAQTELSSLQTNKQVKQIHIEVPSYFHSLLNPDLRSRVVFVDTPGINLSQTEKNQFLNHAALIDDQLQIDEFSFRLNVWVGNYQNLDSDKLLQVKMLHSIAGLESKSQKQEQGSLLIKRSFLCDEPEEQTLYLASESQGNSESQQTPLFLVLNKIDTRRESEDQSLEHVIGEAKKLFDVDNIHLISAQEALNYNIMNYGCKQAQERLIEKYYEDSQFSNMPLSLRAARKQLETIYTCSNNSMVLQNYQDLLRQFQIFIKKSVEDTFHNSILKNLIQTLTILRLLNSSEKRSINKAEADEFRKFLETLRIRLANFKDDIYFLSAQIKEQLLQQISLAVKNIQCGKDPVQILQAVCNGTLADFEKLNIMIFEKCKIYRENLLDTVAQILGQPGVLDKSIVYLGPEPSLYVGCQQFFFHFLENQVYQFQQQCFETYQIELQNMMQMEIKSKVRKISLFGTSLSLSVVGMLGARTLLTSAFAVSPAIAALGMGLFSFKYQESPEISSKIILRNLDLWRQSMERQVDATCQNYQGAFEHVLDGIKNLIERTIG